MLSARDVEVDIRLFRYGVGFLVLNTTFTPEDEVPYSFVLHVDKIISRNVKEVFTYYIGENEDLNIESTRRGIVYESIEIVHDSYVFGRKENIVLMACSANKRTYISDAEELKQELDEKYLSRGDFVFYGFSKKLRCAVCCGQCSIK